MQRGLRGIAVWGLFLCTLASLLTGRSLAFETALDVIISEEYGSELTRWAALLEEDGLSDLFSATTGKTFFLPTNDAFVALDDLQLDLADLVTTVDIVAYHILEGEWKSTDLPDNEAIVLGNQTYYKALSSIDGQMYVTDQIGNQGSVVLADIEIANGCVVHLLNTVLLPLVPRSLQATLELPQYNYYTDVFLHAMYRSAYRHLLTSSTANITLLVPINAAINLPIDIGVISNADLNPPRLDEIIAAHIIPGGQTVDTWTDGMVLQTYNPSATLRVAGQGYTASLIGEGSLADTEASSLVWWNVLGNPAGTKVQMISTLLLPARSHIEDSSVEESSDAAVEKWLGEESSSEELSWATSGEWQNGESSWEDSAEESSQE